MLIQPTHIPPAFFWAVYSISHQDLNLMDHNIAWSIVKATEWKDARVWIKDMFEANGFGHKVQEELDWFQKQLQTPGVN